MATWQIQQAKTKFSELLEHGPKFDDLDLERSKDVGVARSDLD